MEEIRLEPRHHPVLPGMGHLHPMPPWRVQSGRSRTGSLFFFFSSSPFLISSAPSPVMGCCVSWPPFLGSKNHSRKDSIFHEALCQLPVVPCGAFREYFGGGDASCPASLLNSGLSQCLTVPAVLSAPCTGEAPRLMGLQISDCFLPPLCHRERKQQLHDLQVPQSKVMSLAGWELERGDWCQGRGFGPWGWRGRVWGGTLGLATVAGGCHQPLQGSSWFSQAATRALGRRQHGTWTPWAFGCSPACWTRRALAPKSCAAAAHRG